MKEVLLATNNLHKVQELESILSDLSVKILTPAQLGLTLDVDETGSNYLENALLKAQAFHRASGLPCLADDSGLEVQALEGQPGLHSHRALTQAQGDFEPPCLYLPARLQDFPRPWRACFHSMAVFYLDDARVFHHEGLCHGQIIAEARGSGGFGFDPVFVLDEGDGRTMAELDAEEKNHLSHRAKAFRGFSELRAWSLVAD